MLALTKSTKTFSSSEDFHIGFHASLCGKDILLGKVLVRASVISVFNVALANVHAFFYI